MEEAIMQMARTTERDNWNQRLIQGVLKATTLFRSAAPAQIAAIARQCSVLEARRGAAIVVKEARMAGVFAVAHGTAKLSLRQGRREERVVRLLHAGHTFGEPCALLGRAPAFEAAAVTDCKLIVIPAMAIFSLIERDPRCARDIVLGLAERSVELLAELEASSTQGSVQRLASYLDSLVQPGEGNGRCVVSLPASKTVVASRLGMKKETLSRLLRSFAERGLIEVAQREITLLHRDRLAELIAAAG